MSTFHTLDRVKAEASPEEIDPDDPARRARAESEIIGCSDAVLASCDVEVDQLVELYGADRARVEIMPPALTTRSSRPATGPRRAGRSATRAEGPLVLFVGRIQPLKGVDVAVRAFHQLADVSCRLFVDRGPERPPTAEEVAAVHALGGAPRPLGAGALPAAAAP